VLEEARLKEEFKVAYQHWKAAPGKTNWQRYLSAEKWAGVQASGNKIDIIDHLVDADMLCFFRDIMKEDSNRTPKMYGLLPLLASCHLGALNAESFCERVMSCVNGVVTTLHTRMLAELVEQIVVLRINKKFMAWVRAKYGHELVRVFGQDADKPAKSMSLDAQS
jgi:hypothetical protein